MRDQEAKTRCSGAGRSLLMRAPGSEGGGRMSAGFLPIARRQPTDPASFVEGGPAGASADRSRRLEGKRLSALRGARP